MWKVDSSIHLIAVGEVGRWDEMILANCADRMDLVSEHFYCQTGRRRTDDTRIANSPVIFAG